MVSNWTLFTFKKFPKKMRMSEKCRNNNSDNPLTSRRTDGGKNAPQLDIYTPNFFHDLKIYLDQILSLYAEKSLRRYLTQY